MTMEYIRKSYGVPAKRGARVEYRGDVNHAPWQGTIVSADGHYLRIRRDGDTRTYPVPFHPQWGLTYLVPNARLSGAGTASA